jgi:hypothetical protein
MSAESAHAWRDIDAGVLDLLPDAVIGWDIDRRIVHWNRAAVELYGFSRAEALGRRPGELFSTRFPTPLSQMLERMARDGHWHGDLVQHAKGGRELTVESRWLACYDEGGAQSGALAIDRDVSVRVEESYGRERFAGVAERESRLRRLHAAQRLETVDKLAGGVAHEFNNVLAIIINYGALIAGELDTLARTSEDGPWTSMRADLVEIQTAAERGARLTDQLLTFSRHGPGKATATNLDRVVGDTEEELREVLGEQIDLVIALDGALGPVSIDPDMLARALVNLAANSRDAMPEGGVVRIDTANLEVDASFAATRPELLPGPYVRLRVSDTGVGMAPAVLERAFDPFFTTKPAGESAGLGLATVFGMVRQARGRAQLDSEPGAGATFTALFPAAERLEPEPAPAPADYGVETILLVEDEDALRVVTERILGRAGYSVLGAASGAEALEVAAARPGTIDLLLTDVRMPGMSGHELAGTLTGLRPGLRVLYMSGFAGPASGNGTHTAVGELLEKPFTAQTLLECVAALRPAG